MKVKFVIIIVAIAALAAIFFVLKPGGPQGNTADTGTPAAATRTRTIPLTLTEGKLSNTESPIVVKQDERITLTITADTTDELHLHGYDKSIELEPGKAKSVTFTADRSGSFEAELHSTDTPVFVLEVQPE